MTHLSGTDRDGVSESCVICHATMARIAVLVATLATLTPTRADSVNATLVADVEMPPGMTTADGNLTFHG